MKFTITFNEALTLVANVPLPEGSVLKGVTTKFNTLPADHDEINWKGIMAGSEDDYSNNEAALVVKNLTEGKVMPGNTNERIGAGLATGSVKSSDMSTYVVSKSGNKYKLNTASGTAFLDQVKADLAARTGADVANLVAVVDEA